MCNVSPTAHPSPVKNKSRKKKKCCLGSQDLCRDLTRQTHEIRERQAFPLHNRHTDNSHHHHSGPVSKSSQPQQGMTSRHEDSLISSMSISFAPLPSSSLSLSLLSSSSSNYSLHPSLLSNMYRVSLIFALSGSSPKPSDFWPHLRLYFKITSPFSSWVVGEGTGG